MIPYKFIRPFLFLLPPEVAHRLSLNALKLACQLKLIRPRHFSSSPINVMGLSFPNPIGIAAGLDKNGDYINALGYLGAGFIEIGTVTPKPQKGNPRPRLFRLKKEKALINRMGFNNKGVDYLVTRLRKRRYQGILGVNIGKNKETPNEKAVEDYVICFRKVAPFAEYVTLNISSPNTLGLRDLHEASYLKPLLQTMKQEQHSYFLLNKKYVPLVIKLSPDVPKEEWTSLAEILREQKVDGVIIANTTVSRVGLSETTQQTGGLSGVPLRTITIEMISFFSAVFKDTISIMGSGGVFSKHDAVEKLHAGADLIQIYSKLIYEGPCLDSLIFP